MATTTNDDSLLFQLRWLVPTRSLTLREGLWLAELQATRLLQYYGIDEAGTPAELITSLRYVQIVERDDAPVAGGTLWLKPRWLMVLNTSDSPGRMRFSLFHEFKHVLDHPVSFQRYVGQTAAEKQYRAEQAANYFAACALMPRRTLKRLWGQGHHVISELAGQFVVSDEAMTIRLEQIGLVDRVLRPRCNRAPGFAPIPRDDLFQSPAHDSTVHNMAA